MCMPPGNKILNKIVDGRVVLVKMHRTTLTDDPFRTFDEWRSEAETNAYGDL